MYILKHSLQKLWFLSVINNQRNYDKNLSYAPRYSNHVNSVENSLDLYKNIDICKKEVFINIYKCMKIFTLHIHVGLFLYIFVNVFT